LIESTIAFAAAAAEEPLLETVGARGGRDGITLPSAGAAILRVDRLDADEIAVQVLTAKVLLLCLVLTVIYCALGGLWGVVVTDFFQFFVAMGGSIWLAWVAIGHFGGFAGLVEALQQTYGPARADAMLSMIPYGNQAELATAIAADPGIVGADGPFRLMTFSKWLMFVLVVWYALGFTDGGSYLGQRMIAARSERDAALGYLWYAVGHFAVRMWPWLLVGAAGAALFPTLADQQRVLPALGAYDAEYNYILVMRRFLGPGMLGVVVASFLAAYMSTVSTHVNLAAGYLVNDFYRPFVRPAAGERHLVLASTIATVGVGAIGTIVTLYMNSIKSAWFLLASLNAGIGIVYILRWYWWRINAWSEIACFASVLVGTLALTLVSWGATYDRGLSAGAAPSGMQLAWYRTLEGNDWLERANAAVAGALTVDDVSVALVNEATATDAMRADAGAAAERYARLTGSTVPAGRLAVQRDVSFSLTAFPYNYLLLVPWTVLWWVSATLLTRPVDRAHLHAFCRRVRPGGPGWRAISAELPDVAAADSPLTRRSFVGWALAAGGLYAALFGVGALITGALPRATILLAITLGCGVALWRHFSALPAERPATAPPAGAP
jgi:Na+/proline symporter